MSRAAKISIVLALLLVVVVILAMKHGQSAPSGEPPAGAMPQLTGQPQPESMPSLSQTSAGQAPDSPPQPADGQGESDDVTSTTRRALPKLVDLGSTGCIPCKMMEPILRELKEDYADVFEVHLLDVRKVPGAAKLYRVRVIPTQVFIDAGGKELYRHEGFMPREDILKKWKDLGVDIAR